MKIVKSVQRPLPGGRVLDIDFEAGDDGWNAYAHVSDDLGNRLPGWYLIWMEDGMIPVDEGWRVEGDDNHGAPAIIPLELASQREDIVTVMLFELGKAVAESSKSAI